MQRNKRQNTAKEKSLPKETLKESINGEWHGAVAGNASAKNLNGNGSERLNRFALTHSNSTAKLQQNTETTKKKVQNLINNGYAKICCIRSGYCKELKQGIKYQKNRISLDLHIVAAIRTSISQMYILQIIGKKFGEILGNKNSFA